MNQQRFQHLNWLVPSRNKRKEVYQHSAANDVNESVISRVAETFTGAQLLVLKRHKQLSLPHRDIVVQFRKIIKQAQQENYRHLHFVSITVSQLPELFINLGKDVTSFVETLLQRRVISVLMDEPHLYLQHEPGKLLIVLPSMFSCNNDALLQQLEVSLTKSYGVGSEKLFFEANIGVFTADKSQFGIDDSGLFSWFEYAQYASLTAQQSLRLTEFCEETYTQEKQRFSMLQKLNQSIEKSNFSVNFQAQYCLDDQRIIGFEALVRWYDCNGTAIPPTVFIPMAEKKGLIFDIERLVIIESLRLANKLESESVVDCQIAVNLSALHLSLPYFITFLTIQLKEQNVEPERLVIELTETAHIRDKHSLVENVTILRNLGVKIALDDLGTGYAGLERVLDIPCDIIKIDTDFVARMLDDEAAVWVVESLLQLGMRMKKRVIAEGIETESQLNSLKQMGCKFGQGFLFTYSVAAEDAIEQALVQSELIE